MVLSYDCAVGTMNLPHYKRRILDDKYRSIYDLAITDVHHILSDFQERNVDCVLWIKAYQGVHDVNNLLKTKKPTHGYNLREYKRLKNETHRESKYKIKMDKMIRENELLEIEEYKKYLKENEYQIHEMYQRNILHRTLLERDIQDKISTLKRYEDELKKVLIESKEKISEARKISIQLQTNHELYDEESMFMNENEELISNFKGFIGIVKQAELSNSTGIELGIFRSENNTQVYKKRFNQNVDSKPVFTDVIGNFQNRGPKVNMDKLYRLARTTRVTRRRRILLSFGSVTGFLRDAELNSPVMSPPEIQDD